MSIETLREFERGVAIAEAVIAQYPHGSQRDAVMTKLAEARAIADGLLGAGFKPPAGGMACRMS